MSRLLTREEIEALRASAPYIPAPRERLHLVVDAGHAELTPAEVAALRLGSVIQLDRGAGEPVDVVANAVTIARGVLVRVGDRAGIRIVKLAESPPSPGRTEP